MTASFHFFFRCFLSNLTLRWSHPTPWSLTWCLCVMSEWLRKMALIRPRPYMCTSISLIQTEPTLMTEDSRAPFLSPATLSRHQSSRAWRFGGESDSWPETQVIWVLLQADRFQWSLMTQELLHVPGFPSCMQLERHCCSQNVSILTCLYTTWRPDPGL